MNSDYLYLEFIKIAKECRIALIEDTLNSNSSDIYSALYSNSKSKVYQIQLELYEIQWIELHWKKIKETIENSAFSSLERKELISKFAKWYRSFVSNWDYTEFDTIAFEERMNILKTLISVNNEWESDLKRMKISFEKSKKMLNKKINALEMEEF